MGKLVENLRLEKVFIPKVKKDIDLEKVDYHKRRFLTLQWLERKVQKLNT